MASCSRRARRSWPIGQILPRHQETAGQRPFPPGGEGLSACRSSTPCQHLDGVGASRWSVILVGGQRRPWAGVPHHPAASSSNGRTGPPGGYERRRMPTAQRERKPCGSTTRRSQLSRHSGTPRGARTGRADTYEHLAARHADASKRDVVIRSAQGRGYPLPN